MSYEECPVHETDATNGCEVCDRERRAFLQGYLVAKMRFSPMQEVSDTLGKLTTENLESLAFAFGDDSE